MSTQPPSLPAGLRARRFSDRQRRSLGFTLIELMTVIVVMGALAAMAVAKTKYTVEQAKIARAIGDLRALAADIGGYLTAGNALPVTLADVDRDGMLDPWGRPYVYVNFSVGGSPRIDVFGVSLNTDYDVYSLGPDGSSSISLSAASSQDDIVRGNDGGFLGRGSRY